MGERRSPKNTRRLLMWNNSSKSHEIATSGLELIHAHDAWKVHASHKAVEVVIVGVLNSGVFAAHETSSGFSSISWSI